jgi:hypothetical protein
VKKENVTTSISEIQGIIREYFENLNSNKLEKLEDMHKLA